MLDQVEGGLTNLITHLKPRFFIRKIWEHLVKPLNPPRI